MKKIIFAISIAAAALAVVMPTTAKAETLTICTGGERGNYHYLGQIIQRHFKSNKTFDVELVNTRGSMDNLDRMSRGECDAGVAQSDAWIQYGKRKGSTIEFERVGVVFTEFAHFVCNTSVKIKNVLDLKKRSATIAIGKPGSGTWVTWQGVVDTEKAHGRGDLESVLTSDKDGAFALNAVQDGSEVQCMLQVASPPHTIMNKAASDSARSKYLQLKNFSDSTFDNTKDAKNRTIYKPGKITDADYPEFGSGWHVDTIAVDAVFALNAVWAEENISIYESLAYDFSGIARKVRADKSLVLQK